MMPSMLRVERLDVHNYRCFADCRIDLHERLTVLVAENGQGKTALLDAIGDALEVFVDAVTGTRQFHGLNSSDVRLVLGPDGSMTPATPAGFKAWGELAGEHIEWHREIRKLSARSRASKKGAEHLRAAASHMREKMSAGNQLAEPMLLPLVAFYGTGRLWNENDVNERKKRREPIPVGRFVGYVDCLSSKASFKGLLEWFERTMAELGDAKFSREQSDNLALVEAVREATRIVLGPTGWQELIWNYEHKRLDVKHVEYGVLPLSALSDGVRNMVALVADIARRGASLNPHLREQAARRTPGVLLIDEVDMHLHPRWQQLIVASLQEAFPALQMIVSTHSPHVLSTVSAESIRVIRLRQDQGIVEMPDLQTQGVESSGVLSEVMEVQSSPPVEQAEWLSDYRALVQTSNEESMAGKELWNKLVEHFGEEHPVVAEMQVLRRLQEFRRENQVPPQQGQ